MLDAATETESTVAGTSGGVHIRDGGAESAIALVEEGHAGEVWRMMCGAECLVLSDLDLVPLGFDFYELGSGHEKATCEPCRKAAGL